MPRPEKEERGKMKDLDHYSAVVGRLALAAIFLISAIPKLTAYDGTVGYIASAGLPLADLGLWIAVGIEVLGGLAIVLGYQTRVAALVLAVFSVATAVFFHNNFADENEMIHFLKNIAIAGGFLILSRARAGPLSLDARRAAAAI
jgi:putative oxidoreductase